VVRHRKGLRLAWDVRRTSRKKPSIIAARQAKRLADLIEFARTHSSFYRKLYANLTPPIIDKRHLPPVTKQELMGDFDDWVTDPAVTRAGVDAFIADKTQVGDFYLGRYAVWTSSGVTGRHGIFLHDREALTVYATLTMVRGLMTWMKRIDGLTCLHRGERGATVIKTGGHFVGATVRGLYLKHYPRLSRNSRTFSVMTPLAELVKELNALQPFIVISYPTVMALLGDEQRSGRLKIKPILVATIAEWLGRGARDEIAAALNCPVRDAYAASEFMGIAFECKERQLHVNSDWVILEPVDVNYQPVPPGEASRTVLITNLANRVQPIIRYDLGDSITLNPDPCPCGSPLPAIRVEGRRDEILSFQAPGGEMVKLPPRAMANAVEGAEGIRRCQVIQTAPEVLTIRIEAVPGSDSLGVWEGVVHRMRNYLSAQGLPSVKVEKAQDPPMRDPASGKFRTVWSELKTEKG
jgi:phenylacetate-coenzyme A ligase PaaK-like adenylate-forming protein